MRGWEFREEKARCVDASAEKANGGVRLGVW